MKIYTHCALCARPFPKTKREKTHPHKRIEPARAMREVMGRVLYPAEPEKELTDYTRPVIVVRKVAAQSHPYYPFCTLRCGFDYGATLALGADINALREKRRR